jgi:hypothetical protein
MPSSPPRGEGVNAPAGSAERAALRAKALGWLRADLALTKKQAASASATERMAAVDRLTDWLADGDLSAIRPGPARKGLSAEEHVDWDKFWAEVHAALHEAR